ncbi:Beta-1,4-galactosyltransferase 2, partial [Bulinus truncatus]
MWNIIFDGRSFEKKLSLLLNCDQWITTIVGFPASFVYVEDNVVVLCQKFNEQVPQVCNGYNLYLVVLGGHLDIDRALLSLKQLVSKYKYLQREGRFRPSVCEPLQRLAVIIPYRKRWSHLMVLLNNLIPFLIRQQADVTFFVIQQRDGGTFNRGALLNIGFFEAMKVGRFDCFIFHDVDLIPLDDRNLYRCGDKPRHFAVALNKYFYSILYPGYFGGVVGLTTRQFREINGNSNLYVGWGGEDDDLLQRIFNKGYYISRYASDISKYDMIRHDMDKGNEPNPYREKFLELAKERQEADGLNTVRYNKTTKDFSLFTLVMVDINNEEMLLV